MAYFSLLFFFFFLIFLRCAQPFFDVYDSFLRSLTTFHVISWGSGMYQRGSSGLFCEKKHLFYKPCPSTYNFGRWIGCVTECQFAFLSLERSQSHQQVTQTESTRENLSGSNLRSFSCLIGQVRTMRFLFLLRLKLIHVNMLIWE